MNMDETSTQTETISGRENLRETGREAASAARERADALRAEANDALAGASAEAQRRTEAAKGRTAEEISRTAHGLETAADELEGSPLQQDLLREAAGGLKQISQAVDGKSISQMTGDLSDFARRNPMAYLGGAALAGFALARFARAGHPDDHSAAYPETGPGAAADAGPARPVHDPVRSSPYGAATPGAASPGASASPESPTKPGMAAPAIHGKDKIGGPSNV